MGRIMEAVSQRGFHSVLYGDRGVGKTSLANVLPDFLKEVGANVLIARANADFSDDYSTLWRKVLQEVTVLEVREGIGFDAAQKQSVRRLIDEMPDVLRPDDVRRALAAIGQQVTLVIVIDEFDRLREKAVTALVADTIKTLSDSATPATVVLIGVADSVDGLIEGHRSIERSLVQVPMPRMSRSEIEQIVQKGVERLGMTITTEALGEITRLSQGLPYVTHMLSLYSVRAALDGQSLKVATSSVEGGIKKSLEQWQESIKTTYYDATKSHQPDHLYKEVLLACALADVDEKSFFTAAAVRNPLKVVVGRDLDIPNFARHLKEFSGDKRGNVLVREGETRRLRYRFVSPLMRPYIIMRGVADGLLTQEKREAISATE
jgi:Cdc6-like AAA superfamily ATPase